MASLDLRRQKIYRDTTIPLDGQSENIFDPIETATPSSKRKQTLATFCATLGCFLNGSMIGYSSPAIPSLMNPNGTDLYGNSLVVNSQQVSWITGIMSLGCFLGCLIAGPISEKIGRKSALLYCTATSFFLGYLLIFLANHVALIYIGRLVGGVGMGFELAIATVYIVEIASTDMRGFLGCFVTLMQSVGLLVTFLLGSFLNWYWLAMVNGITVAFFVIGLIFIPESPRWLLLKGKELSAMKSLSWLRATDEVTSELEKIKRNVTEKLKERNGLLELRTAIKPFLLVLGLNVFLQLTGWVVLLNYTESLFRMLAVSIDPDYSAVMIGFTAFIACLVGLALVSRVNRKVMMVASMIAMAVSHIVLALCFHFQPELSSKEGLSNVAVEFEGRVGIMGWIPVLAVILFVFMGGAGYGTLLWVITTELLPPKVRSIAVGIIICLSFLLGFFVAKSFVDLLDGFGHAGTFFFYGAAAIVAAIFTAVFIPETRGKSIEEIQKYFNKTTTPENKEEDIVENTPLQTIEAKTDPDMS